MQKNEKRGMKLVGASEGRVSITSVGGAGKRLARKELMKRRGGRTLKGRKRDRELRKKEGIQKDSLYGGGAKH